MSADIYNREPTRAAPPVAPANLRGWLWFGAKAALSVVVLAVVLTRIDLSVLKPHALLIPWLIAGVAALVGSIVIGALRWSLLTGRDNAIAPRQAISWLFASQFVGQILPSSLGQDAVRAWLAIRGGRLAAPTSAIIVVDRMFGIFSLATLILAGVPFFMALGGAAPGASLGWAAGLVLSASAGGLVVARFLTPSPAWPSWAADAWRAARASLFSRAGVIVFIVSLLLHGVTLAAVWCIARAVSVSLSPVEAFATIPATIFISQLPISVNGWGVREGAMVVSLGFAGVAPAQALLISILFGVCLLAASLPGALTFIAWRPRS